MSFMIPAGIQLSGPLVLNNYGPILYASLGYNQEQRFQYQIGWLTVAMGGGGLTLVFVDRFPRPKLIAFSIQFCLCCLAIEAALVATYAAPEAPENRNSSALKAAIPMLFVYVVTKFVYTSEICPTHLRAKGIALGIAGLCAINNMGLQVAPTAFSNIGWKFYLCFIIPGTVFVCWPLYWFPDTRGLPLEDVAVSNLSFARELGCDHIPFQSAHHHIGVISGIQLHGLDEGGLNQSGRYNRGRVAIHYGPRLAATTKMTLIHLNWRRAEWLNSARGGAGASIMTVDMGRQRSWILQDNDDD